MNNKDLANKIFPNINKTIEDYEKMYPPRKLADGACVTRFAPSPTGFMHIGNFMSAIIDYVVARQSNGVFYLRNEDTDKSREVDGAVALIMDILKQYHLDPDEYEYDNETVGNYGPYIQSERKEIYHAFIKHLIEIGRAYPCFCSKEELNDIRSNQEIMKVRTGYYGRFASCSRMSVEEAIKRIDAGEKFVIRFRSNGNFDNKIEFDDLRQGKLFLSENDIDEVIMKSENMLPTYHFAHIVDDHLMHTTHVVRGEEWLSSAPKHIQMFNAFGFEPPKYIHTPLIMKKEGESLRKISKRKDPEAKMSYYDELGYPYLAVIESLMTIINSNYEEWHTENPTKPFTDFEFKASKMSTSGALYDLMKLDDISKNIISNMTKEEVYEESLAWANKHSQSLKNLINKDVEYYKSIINIEREQPKPRKDIVKYSDIESLIWYMYDDIYDETDKVYEWQKVTDHDEISKIVTIYVSKYLNLQDKETWFNSIKAMCDELGYASNMKDYKNNPDNYKGNVADVATVLRVALTTKSMTPDLYEIMNILTEERIKNRYQKLVEGKKF